MSLFFEIQLNNEIWKEDGGYVAYAPHLDISSCGNTPVKAKKNLEEAVGLFLEEAKRMGTLEEILKESGFIFNKKWISPKVVSKSKMKLKI